MYYDKVKIKNFFFNFFIFSFNLPTKHKIKLLYTMQYTTDNFIMLKKLIKTE